MTADPEPVEMPEEAPGRASRAAGGCVLAGLGLVPVAVVFAVSPDAGVLTVAGLGTAALWWSVCRPSKIHNLPGGAREPLPSPIELGPEDYVSADQSRIYRKRDVGYAIERVNAPSGHAD